MTLQVTVTIATQLHDTEKVIEDFGTNDVI